MGIQSRMKEAALEAINTTTGSDAEKAAAGADAAVKVAMGIGGPTEQSAVGQLWRILVTGLVIILIGALIGIVWLEVDRQSATSPQVLVTIFTASLTGLLGLFVRPPSA